MNTSEICGNETVQALNALTEGMSQKQVAALVTKMINLISFTSRGPEPNRRTDSGEEEFFGYLEADCRAILKLRPGDPAEVCALLAEITGITLYHKSGYTTVHQPNIGNLPFLKLRLLSLKEKIEAVEANRSFLQGFRERFRQLLSS